MPTTTRHLAILTMGIVAACSETQPDPDLTCEQDMEKCDLPNDPAEVSCTRRRSDAFNENRLAFNADFLRWSCADVQGVTLDDRGQEYCEYFAIATLPADGGGLETRSRILGRNLGADSSYGATPGAVELTANQIAALEADESAVVGACMFTSWNSDVPGPVPACAPQSTSCPQVFGLPVSEQDFRMTFEVNSADAGALLVDDCFTQPTEGDYKNPRDLRHDAFMRGCLWDAEINETEFRKSDTTICSSMVRLSECGCSVTGDTSLRDHISPLSARGFRLGTWSGFVSGNQTESKLPANCRYLELGDASQTLVECDLTAGDVLYGASDVRAFCQEKYADNIVVHVPVPSDLITCDPSTSTSSYAGECSATPWILTP